MLKALADSSRLLLVNALMEKPQYVEELAQRLNLATSTVSFHLKKLESANLVTKIKEQYYFVYHLNKAAFQLTLRELTSVENIEKLVQEERIQNYKEKVIRSFFKNGKLLRIPTQHKKRWIVLEKIAKQFKPDKVYTEKEVNHLITEFHEDFCTIRRDLIDEKILERDGSRYWLSEVPLATLEEEKARFQYSFQQSVQEKFHHFDKSES